MKEKTYLTLDCNIEMPNLRIPISFIIDDSAPCINPLYYFRKQVNRIDFPIVREGVPMLREIPNNFLFDFIKLINEEEVKGKFSLLPYPAGLGSIEKGLEGFKEREVKEFVSLVKNELIPRFDITPEILTHTLALDLKSNKLLNISEHDWSQNQNRKTLANYIERALEILKNVDIIANGVTSPCNFGEKVENNYARAILDAQKRVNNLSLTWYFLHFDKGEVILPKIIYLNETDKEGVVSIISGCHDFIWETMSTKRDGKEYVYSLADKYISLEGTSGRIVELFNNNSYIVCCTHWQSLFSNGRRTGLRVFEEVVSRINRILNKRIKWMKCSEIARYYATAKSVKIIVEKKDEDIYLIFYSPFKCPEFTLSFVLSGDFAEIEVYEKKKKLKKISENEELKIDTWFKRGEKMYVCFDIDYKTSLVLKRGK